MRSITTIAVLLLCSGSYAFQSDSTLVNSIVNSGYTSTPITTYLITPNIQNNFDQKLIAVLNVSGSVVMENDQQATTGSNDGTSRIVKSKIDGWCFYENLVPRTNTSTPLSIRQLQSQAIALATSLKDANKWILVRTDTAQSGDPSNGITIVDFYTFNFAPVINGIVVASHDYTMSISLRPDGTIENIENNAAAVTPSAKVLQATSSSVQTKLNNRINGLNILNDLDQKVSVQSMQLIKSVTCYVKQQNGDQFYLVPSKIVTASLQMATDVTPFVLTFPLD